LASLSERYKYSDTRNHIARTGHSYPTSRLEYPSQHPQPKLWNAACNEATDEEQEYVMPICRTVVIVENGFGKRLTSNKAYLLVFTHLMSAFEKSSFVETYLWQMTGRL
jgi:hypothetical protein